MKNRKIKMTAEFPVLNEAFSRFKLELEAECEENESFEDTAAEVFKHILTVADKIQAQGELIENYVYNEQNKS